MKGTIKNILLGTSIAIGALATLTPGAIAYEIVGTSDYIKYDVKTVNGTKYTYANSAADVDTLLQGDINNNGGNIELFASSETKNLASYMASTDRTSIKGRLGQHKLTLSSLTAEDWFKTTSGTTSTAYGQNNFANTWFNAFYNEAGLATTFGSTTQKKTQAYNAFLNANLFQASSDPNIAYINTQDDDILIGLAGHYDVKSYYKTKLGSLGNLIKDGFQASEVVKASYNGQEKLLYSFSAQQSGLKEQTDNSSHSGIYQVYLDNSYVPKKVPEPTLLFGLGVVSSLMAGSKRKSQA